MTKFNGFTFAPSLGWVWGGILAAFLLVLASAVPLMYWRSKGHTDAGIGTTIRRTLMLLILAIMALTPSTISHTTNRAINATDVYIAVDVTGSMAVQDAGYGDRGEISRLEAARGAVQTLTTAYPDASFAALRFGASGTLDLPLTPDARAIENWAQGLRTEPTSQSAGSNIDAPLNPLILSLRETRERHPDDRILLYLITDGEQTDARVRRSFTTLRAYLDNAFVLGTGSTQGGKVPISPDGMEKVEGSAPKQDEDQWVKDPQTGQPGISIMDEQNLKALADELSGTYDHLEKGHTLEEGTTAKASKRYRVTTVTKSHDHLTPQVWPLALVEVGLLIWELGNWVCNSRRLL